MPLAEALVARTQERRVIRDRILDTELAEPAVGGVHLHFTADQQPAKSLSYPATEAAWRWLTGLKTQPSKQANGRYFVPCLSVGSVNSRRGNLTFLKWRPTGPGTARPPLKRLVALVPAAVCARFPRVVRSSLPNLALAPNAIGTGQIQQLEESLEPGSIGPEIGG